MYHRGSIYSLMALLPCLLVSSYRQHSTEPWCVLFLLPNHVRAESLENLSILTSTFSNTHFTLSMSLSSSTKGSPNTSLIEEDFLIEVMDFDHCVGVLTVQKGQKKISFLFIRFSIYHFCLGTGFTSSIKVRIGGFFLKMALRFQIACFLHNQQTPHEGSKKPKDATLIVVLWKFKPVSPELFCDLNMLVQV